ncbi:MAG TPA: PAS domain-containing protein [Caulobacteraceae bacterium]|nr:PAS domain-containing protein [Caulobacteraceae bacterium]
MYLSTAIADELLDAAIAAIEGDRAALPEALEALPAPIYVTDASGVVTHFNSACIGFTGRTPEAGKDRWCVTWRLYTDDGEPLPHAECPMAVTIRTGREIRGVTALAGRPNGARVRFLPLPTPLFDAKGELVGAVNMLIDVTEARQATELRQQAARCGRLSSGVTDQHTREALAAMGLEYAAKAQALEETCPWAEYVAA